MAEFYLRVCDLCKIEHRGDQSRHWSNVIDSVKFLTKHHAGLQRDIELSVCTDCGRKLLDAFKEKMAILKEKKRGERE